MLKPPSPSAFLLPKRLKLVSLAGSSSSSPSPSSPAQQQSTANISTDAAVATATASLPAHHDINRQPILLVSHKVAMAQPQPDSPSPTQRTLAATYFPLGYKEAAQQWVSSPHHCPVSPS